FQITARLNRPAYVYLIWIDSTGAAQPVYPWQPGDWTRCPAEEPVAHLLLPHPDASYGTWPLHGPAGVDTLVLLARDTPLPGKVRARLRGRLRGFAGRGDLRVLPDPPREYWFTCRDEEAAVGTRAVGFGAFAPTGDALFQLHSGLRDQLGASGRFRLIRAVSF